MLENRKYLTSLYMNIYAHYSYVVIYLYHDSLSDLYLFNQPNNFPLIARLCATFKDEINWNILQIWFAFVVFFSIISKVNKLWILKFNLSNEYTKGRLNKMSNNSNCTLQNRISEVFCSIFRFNNSQHELTGLHCIIQNVIKYTCI